MDSHKNRTVKKFLTIHRIYSLILLCFAIFMVAIIIPQGIEQGYDVGTISSSLLPKMLVVLLSVCAIIQLFQSDKTAEVEEGDTLEASEIPTKQQTKKGLLLFGVICMYVYGVSLIGFIWSSMGFAIVILMLSKVQSKKQWLSAFLFILILWLIAEHVLEIPLP